MQIGHINDTAGKIFDIFIAFVIFVNLFVTIYGTFDEALPYRETLYIIEGVTVTIFIIEYLLRLWTADCVYPNKKRWKSIVEYIFSFYGIVDFITIIVFFLPFFSAGAVVFRMLRVIKIFNLFKANKYNESFNVIANVLKEKRGQIFSSVFIITVLMIASSLFMYSIENEAQPDVFENAFSGIWWAASTLLTIGYGDIYPITTLGRIAGILISFLGVGLVAIPTGIISAGFIEQQTKIKTKNSFMDETNVRFVVLKVTKSHQFLNKKISEINLPTGLIVSVVIRDEEALLPKGDMLLEDGDKVILAAEAFKDDVGIILKEVAIKEKHPWVNDKIKNLNISRQTLIIVIRRKNKIIIPNGDTIIRKGDVAIVYSKKDIDEIIEGIDVDL
jgi:voltage-gated potassium channel